MIGERSWLDLAVVSIFVLGLITLMLVIRAKDRGREQHEIVHTVVLIWAAVAITLTLAALLEAYAGGPVFDVRIGPEPQVVTRPLTTSEIVILSVVLAALLGLYVTTIVAVRRLIEPGDEDAISSAESPEDDDE